MVNLQCNMTLGSFNLNPLPNYNIQWHCIPKIINPFHHGRKASPTPLHRAYKTVSKTIVAGIYARRHVLSLVPAYEVCVCKWGGAPCTHSTFIEIAPGAVKYSGAHGGKWNLRGRIGKELSVMQVSLQPPPHPPVSLCIGQGSLPPHIHRLTGGWGDRLSIRGTV